MNGEEIDRIPDGQVIEKRKRHLFHEKIVIIALGIDVIRPPYAVYLPTIREIEAPRPVDKMGRLIEREHRPAEQPLRV